MKNENRIEKQRSPAQKNDASAQTKESRTPLLATEFIKFRSSARECGVGSAKAPPDGRRSAQWRRRFTFL